MTMEMQSEIAAALSLHDGTAATRARHITSNRSFSLSPAFDRAKASREPPSAIVVALKRPPTIAPSATTPSEITDYDSLLMLLRARADELQISRGTIDHITGLPDGLSAKILSLNQLRRIGMISLGPLLDALALKLVAVPDDEAFERNRSRYVRRDDPHFRSVSNGQINKQRRERAAAFAEISGTATATLGGAVRYVAPMRFENLSGAVTARMFGQPDR
jgi:hypothetical protein